MTKEIDLVNVPLTPGGVNYDFKAVKEYDFVRYCPDIKFRTAVLVPKETYTSDNEIDISLLETDEEKLQAIINSPMIEVRRRKSFPLLTPEGAVRINPKREDLLETSLGSLTNYKQNRRKTLATIQNISVKINSEKKECDETIEDKENLELDTELDLLVQAVSDSQHLLNNERKRLGDMVSDWRYILKLEGKDMLPETQGDIDSAVGRLQMLLENRFLSTLELLQLGKAYVNNQGVKLSDDDKDYRAGDIYGFVDILIDEIKKLDGEFTKLLKIRNADWIVKSPHVVKRAKSLNRKPKVIPRKIKDVKSRLDIANLRAKFRQNDNTGSSDTVEIYSDLPSNVSKSPSIGETCHSATTADQHSEINVTKKTPTSLKKGIRSKAVLKSTTGTPVHSDTPRPRRSCRVNVEFAVPSANNILSKKIARKRSTINDNSPTTMPKLPRHKSKDK